MDGRPIDEPTPAATAAPSLIDTRRHLGHRRGLGRRRRHLGRRRGLGRIRRLIPRLCLCLCLCLCLDNIDAQTAARVVVDLDRTGGRAHLDPVGLAGQVLDRRFGLVLHALGGGIGGQPRVGQGGTELLGRLVQQPPHHVVGLEQPLTAGVELLDLAASPLASSGEISEHTLAHLLCLRHHPASLRPGVLQRRLGLLGGASPGLRELLAETVRLGGHRLVNGAGGVFRLGLTAGHDRARFLEERLALRLCLRHPSIGASHGRRSGLRRVEGCVGHDALGVRLGLGSDLGGRLPCRGEHARRLCAESLQQQGLVGLTGLGRLRLGPLRPHTQLEDIALEPFDQRRHLVQEPAHLLLLVAPPSHLERASRDVVALETVSHGVPMLGPPPPRSADAPQPAAGRNGATSPPTESMAASASSRLATAITRTLSPTASVTSASSAGGTRKTS